MNIAIIAHAHHPIKQPYAGGLESHTHQLIAELKRQNHHVTLFAKFGSETEATLEAVFYGNAKDGEHPIYNIGYRHAMKRIANGFFDVVINNSLNHTPLKLHTSSMPPMITIFHTPPLPRLISELEGHGMHPNRSYVAVSEFTAKQWRQYCPDTIHVISNGLDTTNWMYDTNGPTAPSAVWIGRITPEKGTHIALKACIELGLSLTVAGHIADKNYFRKTIKPLLEHPMISYAGHLNRNQVNQAFANASVALVTPLWDEPFGLVEIEAWASGTPVAALPNGALPSLIRPAIGSLAKTESISDFTIAITTAMTKDRSACLRYVLENYTLEAMVRNYMYLVPEINTAKVIDLSWQPVV